MCIYVNVLNAQGQADWNQTPLIMEACYTVLIANANRIGGWPNPVTLAYLLHSHTCKYARTHTSLMESVEGGEGDKSGGLREK